jgi:hypothetical protein
VTLQLSAVLTAIRDRHPAFHKTRIPDAVLARFLSDYQNELIGRAVERDKMYLVQSLGIALAINDANDPGTAGAGTTGGLPATVETDGSVAVVQESTGSLIEPLLTASQGGSVVLADRVVTSVVGQVIRSIGAGRTVNADVGRLIHIISGTGIDQVRSIASNTADSWTPNENWTVVPDTTSQFTLVDPLAGTEADLNVVTELPAVSSRTGYLVRITAQGVPYIDYASPLTVWLDRGVPLPEMIGGGPIGGTVRYPDGDAYPLTITTYGRRYDGTRTPAVYVAGGELFLCGAEDDWRDVESIELRFTPVAPVFAALTEYFLVPDAARPTLVAQGAAFAASRLSGNEFAIDVAFFESKAENAEQQYLASLRLAKRARAITFREGTY